MLRIERKRLLAKAFIIMTASFAIIIGLGIGIAVAETLNIRNTEDFTDFETALPTKLLDINGDVITEFYGDEKRELITLDEVPRHLVEALLTREDQEFFSHRGFSFTGISRAVLSLLTGGYSGGGSTITQQLATSLLDMKADQSVWRKLKELWWALQLERRYSKDEILELYMNRMYFGSGTAGVAAASEFLFGHSVTDDSLAESAMLVLQLSSPVKGLYSPLKNWAAAKKRQWYILEEMVKAGYVSMDEAKVSFDDYWDKFDRTRSSNLSAFYTREDKAPWASEYARRQLADLLYGSLDYNRDGFVVHTTFNLEHQKAADALMRQGISDVNASVQADNRDRFKKADYLYRPILGLLTLSFDIDDLRQPASVAKGRTLNRYHKQINPAVDALALMFGMEELRGITRESFAALTTEMASTTVEGALISIENETGYITAIVGGSDSKSASGTNRATQAAIMPGSCFKPLYYSAAIDTRRFTEATPILDAPAVFYNEDGTVYIPKNYKGTYNGDILLWQALAQSLNIPAVKVMKAIGFDVAIGRASTLMGITDPAEISYGFPRVLSLALGINQTSPIKMARAYATFANQGREVVPICIRTIEDRHGKIILDPEKDLRMQQKGKGSAIQVISPQTAYIMVHMLLEVTKGGTLGYTTNGGKILTYSDAAGAKYTFPIAGKTGTTQNWADSWTIGFSPVLTCAVWFGFDLSGGSLGVYQGGGAAAGRIWAQYMQAAHKGYAFKDFSKPQTGLVSVTVCSKSGLLPTKYCTDGTVTRLFLTGTEPSAYCTYHTVKSENEASSKDKLREGLKTGDYDTRDVTGSIPGLTLPPGFEDSGPSTGTSP